MPHRFLWVRRWGAALAGWFQPGSLMRVHLVEGFTGARGSASGTAPPMSAQPGIQFAPKHIFHDRPGKPHPWWGILQYFTDPTGQPFLWRRPHVGVVSRRQPATPRNKHLNQTGTVKWEDRELMRPFRAIFGFQMATENEQGEDVSNTSGFVLGKWKEHWLESGERKAVRWKGPNLVLFMLTERCSGISKKGVGFTEAFSVKGQTVNISAFVGLLGLCHVCSCVEGFIYNPLKIQKPFPPHGLWFANSCPKQTVL